MGQRKGQTGNPEGRPKGALNKTTIEAKELLNSVLSGEVENIKEALQKVRLESESKYLDALAKLFPYVFPKKTDVTSDDKPIQTALNVIVDSNETAQQLKELMNGSKTDKDIPT